MTHSTATRAIPAAAIMSIAGRILPSPPAELDDSAAADDSLVNNAAEVAVIDGDEVSSLEAAAEAAAPSSTV